MNYISTKRDVKEIWKKEEEKAFNESIEKFKSGLIFKGKRFKK